MRTKKWAFPAGARVPRWLVETVDCTAIFNWAALVIEAGEEWRVFPIEPIRPGAPPFLLRPKTKRHRGVAVPTRPIKHSYRIQAMELTG